MMARVMGYALGAGLAVAAFSTAPAFAAADTNLVLNGNFETTTVTSSAQMTSTNVANWTTSGYNFIFLPDASSKSGTQADTTGGTPLNSSYPQLKLWGPGNDPTYNNGNGNGLTVSPAGKNFIAADNNFGQGGISQTIANLTIGTVYQVKFYWAAAQQYGFDGVTQEQWTVKFGSQSQATEQVNLPNHGFSGWKLVTMNFMASATSQTLSFLATGTPGGNPPFSLLDGVSMTAVPEPGTWALLATGVFGLGFMTWRRRRATGSAPVAAA